MGRNISRELSQRWGWEKFPHGNRDGRPISDKKFPVTILRRDDSFSLDKKQHNGALSHPGF